MQKDVHFYLTYAIARNIGIPAGESAKIAWADQYTDDLTEADLHGIQTQSGIVGNWEDRQIQLSVLAPFHFVPGDDANHPWKTTRNSAPAKHLIEVSLRNNCFHLGIALHALQDTFSHEGFSGWLESLNSCYPWYYVKSTLPNVGHAEMRVVPDVVNYVWTDPRDGRRIDNKKRTMAAARSTFDCLATYYNRDLEAGLWKRLQNDLRRIFKEQSYDERKKELAILSGNNRIKYSDVKKKLEDKHKSEFILAARDHLSEAMRLFGDLPR